MARDNSKPASKNDVKEIVIDASPTVLEGVDRLLKNYATKKDLKKFSTKEDLKREILYVRDDIKGLKADLSDTPSRKQFEELKRRVDHYHPTTQLRT
ncbi:MAG: hypothetical protein ACC618_04075 [Patescibacteria group bacterium]